MGWWPGRPTASRAAHARGCRRDASLTAAALQGAGRGRPARQCQQTRGRRSPTPAWDCVQGCMSSAAATTHRPGQRLSPLASGNPGGRTCEATSPLPLPAGDGAAAPAAGAAAAGRGGSSGGEPAELAGLPAAARSWPSVPPWVTATVGASELPPLPAAAAASAAGVAGCAAAGGGIGPPGEACRANLAGGSSWSQLPPASCGRCCRGVKLSCWARPRSRSRSSSVVWPPPAAGSAGGGCAAGAAPATAGAAAVAGLGCIGCCS